MQEKFFLKEEACSALAVARLVANSHEVPFNKERSGDVALSGVTSSQHDAIKSRQVKSSHNCK